MKERRREFLFFFSGSSEIRCIVSPPECDLRLEEATLSDFLLDGFLSGLSWSASRVVVGFLMNKGRFADSLSALGRRTAWTSSVTEEFAFSFSRAEEYTRC